MRPIIPSYCHPPSQGILCGFYISVLEGRKFWHLCMLPSSGRIILFLPYFLPPCIPCISFLFRFFSFNRWLCKNARFLEQQLSNSTISIYGRIRTNIKSNKQQNIVRRQPDMEDMARVETPPKDDQTEITRSLRDLPPAHYIFKIENFSLLSNAKVDNFESGDFEVQGYKWRLSLYPNGNKKRGEDRYLSLYLALSKSNVLPLGWEIKVNFKLFVYNQKHDKYLAIQDADGRVRRFHGMKTELGFDQLLLLTAFKDDSNGYLMDDRCIFGAEIFVIEHTGKGECLSMTKQPVNSTFTWPIPNFSALDQECYRSKVFVVGGRKWTLLVYPKGISTDRGKSLSMFLALEDRETLSSGQTLYVEFVLRVKDQLFGKHLEKEANCHFTNSIKNWGHADFMPLDELYTLAKGFLVNNTLAAEVQIQSTTTPVEFSRQQQKCRCSPEVV